MLQTAAQGAEPGAAELLRGARLLIFKRTERIKVLFSSWVDALSQTRIPRAKLSETRQFRIVPVVW